ncbi:MAG: 2OG-Fe(II) oxygenase [Opitutaceae bacterium]|nr:2OG-Fe(II) oxygenase [Cytophagales bacterium]
MNKDFETLVNGYIEENVGIADHFLSDNLATHLKTNLLALYVEKLFTSAGVGNAEKLIQDKTVRSDEIYWLNRKGDNQFENEFFVQIEGFIRYLNMNCYAGIQDCEFHYSLYEPGSFYKRHLDQFQNNSNRKFSMISYLNEDWTEADGGQLMIHQAGADQKIDPTSGKMVFFKSDELLHEVLVTNKQRMSVTGWLKSENYC